MKAFFLALSAIFAAVPGITVLLSSLGVPDSDDKTLFCAVIEATGCATVALVYINRRYFKKMNIHRINKSVISLVAVFSISVILYISLFKNCVIDHEDYSRVYFPLVYGSALKKEIKEAGNRIKFIEKWEGDGANQHIELNARNYLILTTVVFLVIYQLIFTSLAAAFSLLAVRETKIE